MRRAPAWLHIAVLFFPETIISLGGGDGKQQFIPSTTEGARPVRVAARDASDFNPSFFRSLKVQEYRRHLSGEKWHGRQEFKQTRLGILVAG